MDTEEMRNAFLRATESENLERLRIDRNNWQNAANHLKTALKTMITPHKPCGCIHCIALEEYAKAQQGVGR